MDFNNQAEVDFFFLCLACLYLSIVFQPVLNLILQAVEAVRGRPAGRRTDTDVQAVLHLLATNDLGTVRLNWTREKQERGCQVSLPPSNLQLMSRLIVPLTDVSEIKRFCLPGDSEVLNGLGCDFQLGAFLNVRRQGMGQFKLESPIGELSVAGVPLA